MHLVVLRSALEVQADHGNGLAGVSGQVRRGGDPAVGGGNGVVQGDLGDGVGIVLGVDVLGEHNAQAHGHVVIGGLLEGQSQLAGIRHIQVGLVQMHEVIGIHLAINGQRGTAVVGVHQVEIELSVGGRAFHQGALLPLSAQTLLIAGTIVVLRLKSRALRLEPELPGGQDVLDGDVGPLMGVGDFAVHGVDQAVTGVEIGDEGVAVDHRALGHQAGNARHLIGATAIGLTHSSNRVRNGGGVCGIPGRASEPGPLTDSAHPLEVIVLPAHLLTVAEVLVNAGMDKVSAQGGNGADNLTVLPHLGETIVPTVAASLKAAVHRIHAVLLHFADRAGGAPAVILEEGVGRTGVHHLGIDAAAGVVVLDVQAALVPQVLQEGSQLLLGCAGGAVRAFQIHIPAIEAIVLGDLNQLVCIGEAAVLISLDESPPGLVGPGQEDAAQGQNAVLVGGVGIGGVGQVHHTELEGTGFPGIGIHPLIVYIPQLHGGGGCGLAVPGGVVVDVLPEVEAVFAELVGVRGAAEEGVAIVASQGQVLHLRVQAGVGLSGWNRFNAVLQRHPRPQKLRVRVRRRIPGQQVLGPVTVGCGLVVRQSALAPVGQSVTGKGNGGAQRDHHGDHQDEGQKPFQMVFLHLCIAPFKFYFTRCSFRAAALKTKLCNRLTLLKL